MVEEILALSFDITQKAPTSLKDTLKDILERLGMLNGPNLYIGEEYKSTEIKEMQKILSEVWQDKHEPWEKQLRELEYEERVNGVMAKLKPPQEERLKELMSLKKIEQSLDGKTNIDPNTWQEINELLNLEKSLEKSLPQADQDKKNFLKELEQKFLSSDGQTQLQTLEEINRIGDEILKIFQNSIEDALEQGNSENGRPQDDSLLKQLEEDVIGLIQDQSRLSTNRFTGLSEKELSKSLQDILDSIDKDLVDKLKNLAISYNNRTSDKNYQDLRKLGNFREILELDKDENRLQSVLAMIYPTASQWVFHMDDAFRGYEGNYNMRKNVIVDALDDKLPLTGKFKGEVAETIKLIFQNYGIDEKEIMPFLKDLEKVTDVLGKPVSLKHNDELRRGELEYFRTIIEDFRDTKHHLDINIFKEFSSWKQVFQNKNLDVEEGILVQLGKSLTFANGIDSINFYAASEHVRQALVYTLPLRSEISNQQKQEANLPTSKDPVVIRQEIRKIFDYGLQEGNNDQTELQENKKTIQKILKLLHEAKLVNFLENSNGEIDIYTSYTKALKINVLVWDEDYQLPLHRSTDYHCRVEYAGNGKVSLNNNTVQTVEEF
ncbi:MAG: hypothetical protein LBS22_03090 [Puniceicoccales bacterium]|nr:hypothetical protein [Puniceicoccales bacterium]